MSDAKPDVKAIFCEALAKSSPEELAAYLEQACGGDDQLRQRVEALLRADRAAGQFLGGSSPGDTTTFDAPSFNEGPGSQIGPYKLLERLGEGAFGVVYMAEQREPVRRKVALKILKPGMDTRHVVARFEAEEQALALMDHPNIARVFDAGATESGRPYFVMELVKGRPITEYCDVKELTTEQRLELFIAVCHAVQHAHQKGIIHRDIKPSNVLVEQHDDKPVVKVIDFGVAKALHQPLTEKTLFTGFGQVVGTVLYMSPEQAELNALDVDTRSDVYSLGVLLYELLTGVTPFDRKRLLSAAFDDMRRIIREEEPPKPSTRISTLGPAATDVCKCRRTEPKRLSALIRGELDWIVMRALEKDRGRRYETANELAADVQRHLDGESVEACPPSLTYRLRKAATRHRMAVTMTAVVAIALLGATLTSTWFAVDAIAAKERERRKAVALAEAEASLRQTIMELQDELRETCLAAVMSGDQSKARAAIQKAERVGLSAAWLNILHGQLALSTGRSDDAVKYLEPVAGESLAASGMLAMAHIYSGRIEECVAIFDALRQRTPVTLEDHLFMGQALIFSDAKEAEGLIRHAIQKYNSPLAHMFRAEALAHIALDTGDRESVRQAVWESRVARCFIGDTPIMLKTHLFVQHVAIKLGELRVSDEILAEARLLARRLKDFPAGRLELAWFLADFGDEESAVGIWSGMSRVSGYESITYAACRLARNSPEQVLRELEDRFQRSDLYTEMTWAGVASLVPARHNETCERCDEIVRSPASYDVRNAFLQVLCLLGNVDDARRLARELGGTSVYPVRYQKELMQYIAGDIETGPFLERAGPSRINRTAALFGVGVDALASGRRAEARVRFKECADVGLFVDGVYWWAKRYLAIMDEDPTWPAWIPCKQTE